ncbi:glycosyltransferase family 9 protein [Sediminitomix flava]|uniref:Heptosyltransferase-2 n=1 Tax=Sediminitomix flava TaxID=379075 RepID=A0A315YWS5_SEDFL|nr:glycosyltransferase family 9 protein [Sediminitomix flava]PWJ34224.1 heptosyltransferase-2 [Sediminitomix flava]
MELTDIKFDCIHFKGAYPCKPNKTHNRVCLNCEDYQPISKRILIIKLGAIGDVIRTTPLLIRYRELYPNAHITWLTLSPAVLPKDWIDEILTPDATAYFRLQNMAFDIAINLDKEHEACALLAKVEAKEKYGFIWKDNHIDVATEKATHKLMTGLDDQLSQDNERNYLDEIFEICHQEFRQEPYLLNINEELSMKWNSLKEQAEGKKIVGLNTGCGARWQTRLWTDENWIAFAKLLKEKGYYPVLLGGKQEDEKNRFYSEQADVFYPGHFSLEEFIALTANCDIIVTQVSMMMHIATGLKKKMVLFNNIFNKYEFELYGRGVIVEPQSGCDCFYGNSCSRERRCMHDLSVEQAMTALEDLN